MITVAEAEAVFAEVLIDIAAGKYVEAARKVFDTATELVPVDQLKEFLTDYDRQAADIATDVAEEVKLDP